MNSRIGIICALVCFQTTGMEATVPTPGTDSDSTPAERKSTGAEERVGPLQLRESSVDQVLELLEHWTNKAVLRPQTLPSTTLSVNIPEEISKDEAVRALETLLSLNGLVVAPMDDHFIKVMPIAAAKGEAPEMIRGSTLTLPPSPQIASKLFQLKFLRAAELTPQLTGLLNSAIGSPPVVFDKNNAVMVTDSIANLQRIENLILELDRPELTGLKPKIYTLNNAKASDVVTKLKAAFGNSQQAQLGAATSISADDRTNQIVLFADPKHYLVFDELIEKFDLRSGQDTRNEIVFLKYAAAKDVATSLSLMVTGQTNAAKSGSANVGRTTSQTPIETAAPSGSSQVNETATRADNPKQFSQILTILPEERSNALLISGTVSDIKLIREFVSQIDVVLPQVRIEVVIAEVTLSDTDKNGLSALNLTVGPNAKTATTQVTQFSGSVGSWTISNGIVSPASLNAVLGDSGSTNRVRILSMPTIVTTHNKEAEVLVGQSQPIITGTQSTPMSTSSSSSGFATSSQVSYKDIAIDLKVTPLIGEDGAIQLKIDQKVDDIVGNITIDNNAQPIIGRRQATAFVTVEDNQMIVLGGLQRTKKSVSRSKIGGLFEIPVISQLFGGREKDTERTELLLFVRPHIIRTKDAKQDTQNQIDRLSEAGQINEYLQPATKK